MRQVARKGLITVAAASGMLAIAGGYAHADAGAKGLTEDAAGLLSGNVVQAPIDVPVNLCGNTVNVLGALNPAAGNECVNRSSSGGSSNGSRGSSNGSGAVGVSEEASAPGSGNLIQAPINVPVNLCGNNIGLAALDNAALDNGCAQGSTLPDEEIEAPDEEEEGEGRNPNTPETDGNTGDRVELAETGASDSVGFALPAGAALILGGAVLYRRARAASRS